MAVPKRRKTRARRNMRRSHHGLNVVATFRHFMKKDGTYRGRLIKSPKKA